METTTKVVKSVKDFSSAWWDGVLAESKNLSVPAVFKNCMTAEETFSMRQSVLDIMRELARLRTHKYGYRVFTEEGTMFNKREMYNIYDNPPLAGDSLQDWWSRLFGERKVGMMINDGERFDFKLSKMIAEKLEPLLKKIGIPTDGIGLIFFIGNYKRTAFGAHMDWPGDNVMHFHLGPGPKTIYTWDTDEYRKLAGTKNPNNNLDLDELLPIAQKNEFAEGDLFCMPEDTFHVGMQEGLSIGISCWFFNRSTHHYGERLITLLSDYLGKADFLERNPENNLKPDKNPLNNGDFLESTGILDVFELPDGFKELSFNSLMKEIYIDYKYSLSSNSGYRSGPFPKEDEFDFNLDDTIQLEKPYSLKYKLSLNKEKLHIFVRGNKFEFNNFDCVTKLIDKVNEGNPIKVSIALALLDEEWGNDVGFYILNLLYKHHGIKVN